MGGGGDPLAWGGASYLKNIIWRNEKIAPAVQTCGVNSFGGQVGLGPVFRINPWLPGILRGISLLFFIVEM